MTPAGPARDEHAEALDRAVRALARRDHSAASLRRKLLRAGVGEELCEDVLAELIHSGYVDDARFACARAEQLGARGYGDDWIRADLEAQGIARDASAEAVAALAPEQERAAEQARSLGDPRRALRVLQRRGFSPGSLEGLHARLIAEDP